VKARFPHATLRRVCEIVQAQQRSVAHRKQGVNGERLRLKQPLKHMQSLTIMDGNQKRFALIDLTLEVSSWH